MGRCMKPIIAAIDGYCVASGFNAAVLFSDIRICTERAKFGMPMVRRGLGASGNEGYPMPFLRYINLGNLLYMYLTASLITAEQAYHFGLVSEVVPHEELMQRATELAEMICEGAPIFVRRYKELFRLEAQAPGFDTRTLMSVVMRGLEKSEDVIEGRRAFLEKRKPIWKGK
jgi:enoyl-CoA hydratase/carnithine racemase